MEAVILAGGLGTRLKEVVNDRPKCMADVDGMPFVWYWMEYLKRYNITKIVFSLGYKAEYVIKWLQRVKSQYPFEISYVAEDTPLGTGGGMYLALKQTTDKDVLVINGDSVFTVDMNRLFERYGQTNTPMVIALKQMHDFERYGNVRIDENGLIISFEEKKFCPSGYINAGVYVLDKQRVFSHLTDIGLLDENNAKDNQTDAKRRQNPAFSFEKEVLEKRKDIYGLVCDGYFIDIGVKEDYFKAQTELRANVLS